VLLIEVDASCSNNNVSLNTTEEECEGYSTFCGRKYKIPAEKLAEYSILYIGAENSLTLTNLMMNYNKCKVIDFPCDLSGFSFTLINQIVKLLDRKL
jgi:hypothetical protein